MVTYGHSILIANTRLISIKGALVSKSQLEKQAKPADMIRAENCTHLNNGRDDISTTMTIGKRGGDRAGMSG